LDVDELSLQSASVMKPSRLMEPEPARWSRLALALGWSFHFDDESGGQRAALFSDNFDSLGSPIIATNSGVTNGYTLKFSAVAGPVDFKAFSVPTIPRSVILQRTLRSPFLRYHERALPYCQQGFNRAVAAVNLYPSGQSFNGNYMLQFDLWINYGRVATTEHALFGVNHSGQFTNQITMEGSDGLFFAMDGDGGSSAGSATARDYSVFQGGGPPLAPHFSRLSMRSSVQRRFWELTSTTPISGLEMHFPLKGSMAFPPSTVPQPAVGHRSNPSKRRGITWMLNSNIVAQYTNNTAFSSGDIMLYNDTFASIGDSNNFAIIDNLIVTRWRHPLSPNPRAKP